MIEQAVIVTDEQILILGQFFVHKDYSVTNKDVLFDILSKQYRGQRITVRFWDGENIDFSGFSIFLEFVCNQLHIPVNHITIETHNTTSLPFNTENLKLGIFISVNQYLPTEINRDISNARFVGCLLGRYNINRLRLAYEIDQAFPADTFITFQPSFDFITNNLKHVSDQYVNELSWLQQKTFDSDLKSSHYMGMIEWYDACRNYGNVWNKYQIEIISETDAISDFWFTEKTANCLATGKPFILVGGQYSLHKLREMGFQTFNSILNESYDTAPTPYERIKQLTSALNELYNSPSKVEDLKQLYCLANQNIELYRNYCVR